MIPKCKKKFHWNVKKKKMFVNTFAWASTNFTLRLFPFFRPSLSRLLSRSRKLSRLKDFRSELDWLSPLAFHFNSRKSPGATEMDSVIALPALRIAHPRANWSRKTPTRWTLSWKGRRKLSQIHISIFKVWSISCWKSATYRGKLGFGQKSQIPLNDTICPNCAAVTKTQIWKRT